MTGLLLQSISTNPPATLLSSEFGVTLSLASMLTFRILELIGSWYFKVPLRMSSYSYFNILCHRSELSAWAVFPGFAKRS